MMTFDLNDGIKSNDYIYFFITGLKLYPTDKSINMENHSSVITIELRLTNQYGKMYIQKIEFTTIVGIYRQYKDDGFKYPIINNFNVKSNKLQVEN